FKDFDAFEDKILMDVRFKQSSKVALKDVIFFAPKLRGNTFFSKNIDEIVQIKGIVKGRVNNLRGKDLLIRLANGTLIKGDFSSRNLAVKSEEALNLKLERLKTDMKTLRLFLPNFDPPPNFDKLGNIDFSGRFDGFFIDFVAFGKLKTALGSAEMDMRMDLRNGRDKAQYSGALSLIDFDLKTWTDNPDFGKITFSSQVRDGFGLSRSTVNAKLGANIEQFDFKGYKYENLAMDGRINENLFDGDLNFKDDNIDFVFDGAIDYSDSIPEFNFKANIARLDLQALNIIKQNYVLAGELNLQLRDRNISRIQGSALLNNFTLVKNDSLQYEVDTLELSSVLLANDNRVLKLHSEIFDASIQGQYDIQQLPEAILQFFERNYPEFAERLDWKSKQKDIEDNQFDYEVTVYDSKNFTTLFAPKLDTLKAVKLKGAFDSAHDELLVDLEVPHLHFGNLKFDDIVLIVNANESDGEIDLGVYHTLINNKQHIEPLSLDGQLSRDTFGFEITAINFTDVLDNLNLNGQFFMVEDYFQVSFLPSDLVLLKENWDIDEDNYLRFGKGFVETKDFILSKEDKTVAVKSISDKGLFVEVKGFDLSLIDEFWNYDKLDFAGDFRVTAEIQDVFKFKDVTAVAIADTFEVNGDDWGALRLDADMASLNSPINVYTNITKGSRQLIVEGYFIPPNAKGLSWMRNKYEINGHIVNYPMHIAEYWIGDGVTNTKGSFDAEVKIYGHSKPKIKGEIQVRNLETTVDYLQTRYYAEQGTMLINDEYLFDATGNKIKDKYGNEADVFGGIAHTNLKKLRLDARVKSDRFLVLDTKLEDNDLYYGHCIGAGDVRFTGPFDKTNIDIEADTGKDSELFIQLSEERDASEVSFIRFIDKNERLILDKGKKQVEIKGIQLDMNLSFNDQAEVYLIFDASAGDIIHGTGNGDLQLFFSRSGNFSMYGDYEIEQGEYLFTYDLFNVSVTNKP
ncbi:MAG: translocation/assembly module TamB domain-containing protein, partial [Bacteroidota bacterium]